MPFCAQAHAQTPSNVGKATNPFHATAPNQNDNVEPAYTRFILPFTSLKIEGRDSYLALVTLSTGGRKWTFALDTGSTFSLVTDEMANALGLVPKTALTPEGKAVNLDGHRTTFVTIEGLHNENGKLNVNGQFNVINKNSLNAIPGLGTADGVLGINVLSVFGVLWDDVHHQVTLFLPRSLSENQRKLLGFADQGVTITQAADNRLWYTNLSVLDKSFANQEAALIDTGSDHTYISNCLANRLGLKSDGKKTYEVTPNVKRDILHTLIRSFSVGDSVVENVVISYPVQDIAWPPPTLGRDFLSRYRVLFDFQQGKIYLAPAMTLVSPTQPKP